jgi:O-Antigen ligase
MSPPDSWHRRLDGVIEASWLAALLLAPVVMAPHHAQPYSPPKAAFVNAFALLGVGAWAVKALTGGPLWHPLGARGRAAAALRRLFLGLGLSAVALGVAAGLSIAPRVAWLGADPRALGAVARLSILALAGLMLGHLRQREQVLRVLEVVALASVPVCLYALLQAFGVDPIFPQMASRRPFSLPGNATILGRYLLPVLFLTLGLLLETARHGDQGTRDHLRQGLLVGLLGLQTWTLVASGSRGPLLGLLIAMGALAWALWARRLGTPKSTMRRGLLAVACLAVVAFAALGWLHETTRAPDRASLARGVRQLVDPSSLTAKVRFGLWRDAAAAFGSREPLAAVDSRDSFHRWRRWIGYGPGLSGPSLVRWGGSALASLEPERLPDHPHNELWNVLLCGGVLAATAWILVHGALFELFLAALGLLRGGPDAARFWAALGAGATAGAILAAGLRPAAGLAVPAGVAGALVGGAAFAVARSVRSPAVPAGGSWPLAALAAAAWLAQLVSGQFGIETVIELVGGVLLWPLLVVAATRDPEPSREPSRSVLPAAATALALSLAWTFVTTRHAALGLPAVRVANSAPTVWLLGATLLCATLLARSGSPGRVLGSAAAGLLTGWGFYRLAAALVGSRVTSGALPWAAGIAWLETALATGLLCGLTGAAAAWGARAAGSAAAGGRLTRRRLTTLAAVLGLAAVVLLGAILRPLAAGFLLHGGQLARNDGNSSVALDLTAGAIRLAADPLPAAVIHASIQRDVGRAAAGDAKRDVHLAAAEAVLRRAVAVWRFHSNLIGDVGLVELERARRATGARRRDLSRDAIAHLEAAVALRPWGGPWSGLLAEARSGFGADTDAP